MMAGDELDDLDHDLYVDDLFVRRVQGLQVTEQLPNLL